MPLHSKTTPGSAGANVVGGIKLELVSGKASIFYLLYYLSSLRALFFSFPFIIGVAVGVSGVYIPICSMQGSTVDPTQNLTWSSTLQPGPLDKSLLRDTSFTSAECVGVIV